MYRILSGGALVALCDKPRYVKRNTTTGVYIEAAKEEAVAIAVRGELYNLSGGNAIPGAPEAIAVKAEEGDLIFGNTELIQQVDSTAGIVFVTLAESGAVDDATAGEHAEMFGEWSYPVQYRSGQIRRYTDGKLYRCLQDHTSQEDWTPDVAGSLWVAIADPTEEWPQWSQPIGAVDTYAAGDKVTHADKHWISGIDNNVWEPGIYGWEEESE